MPAYLPIDPDSDLGWLEALFEPYVSLLGEPVVGTILGSAIVIGFYVRDDSLVMPAVLLLLFGGIVLATVPGHLTGLAYMLIVVAGVAGVVGIARRYVL